MLKINRATKLLAFAAFSSAMLASNAHAASPTGTAADYGTSAVANPYDRKITISAQTKWVNVHDGETVQFDVGGKTFGWHFNTLTTDANFELSKIAPTGTQVGSVRVYVAANPTYNS